MSIVKRWAKIRDWRGLARALLDYTPDRLATRGTHPRPVIAASSPEFAEVFVDRYRVRSQFIDWLSLLEDALAYPLTCENTAADAVRHHWTLWPDQLRNRLPKPLSLE